MNFAPPDWLPYGSGVIRKYRAQGKPLTISHDQLLIVLVKAAPLVAAKKASGGSGIRQRSADNDDNDDLGTGIDPNGIGTWMRRWADGVSLRDVPERAVLLAAAELAIRVDEEEARRAAARAFGVVQVWVDAVLITPHSKDLDVIDP